MAINPQLEAMSAIKAALHVMPAKDHNGFLFALCISDMLQASWTKEMIKEELLKALDVAWENRHLIQ